jgi:hypothetical protein
MTCPGPSMRSAPSWSPGSSIPGEAGSATCSRAGREGWTVFVSSHLMAEMALTADEVIIMPAGRRAPSQQDPPVGGAGRACGSAATSTHLP